MTVYLSRGLISSLDLFRAMSLAAKQFEVPTWAAGLLLALLALSFLYGIVVMQSLAAPIVLWLGMLGMALTLFVVYLFYRFVLAVEEIARKL